jgi:hypothetical protein
MTAVPHGKLRFALMATLLGLAAACASDSPSDIRFVPEWGCLSDSIAGNVANAATPPGPAGRSLGCWRDNRTMSAASFRAADATGDGQVPLAELLAQAEKLFAGRDSLTPAQAPWLTEGQVRRLDPDRTGRITITRVRVLMAQDFTRADRDGSATLTPGRWPLE